MKLFRPFFLLFFLFSVILSGAGCGGNSQAEQEATKPVTLNIWRVFDNSDTFEQIMQNYQTLHPNVSFNYRKVRFEEYEDELIDAFAKGRGPDIFSLHNTWVAGYQDLLSPLPNSLTIPHTEVRGSIKKETVTELRTKKTTTLQDLKKIYVDVVSKDAVLEEKIYSLPLALDTLVLYYNAEFLNAAGIPEPPTTWTEFQEQVKKLTKIDTQGKIIQSGAAFGAGKNVERSSDLLSVLMLQTGTNMTNAQGQAVFASLEEKSNPALDALRFYTDFANPTKDVYTWNQDQQDSLTAFINGKTAFFFGYAYHLPTITLRAPKLDVRITSLPQIGGNSKEVHFANYWMESVARSSQVKQWAWDFLEFATSKEQVGFYLEKTQKPTARRDLIKEQIEKESIRVFVQEILTAQSWYHGKKASVVEQAFVDLIDEVLQGSDLISALVRAQNKVNQTL